MAKLDPLTEIQCLNVLAASPLMIRSVSGVDKLAGFFINISITGWRSVADVFGKLWALPCTLAGLVLGLAGHVISKLGGHQPRLCLGNNAVQF